jgi:hypothetical protein
VVRLPQHLSRRTRLRVHRARRAAHPVIDVYPVRLLHPRELAVADDALHLANSAPCIPEPGPAAHNGCLSPGGLTAGRAAWYMRHSSVAVKHRTCPNRQPAQFTMWSMKAQYDGSAGGMATF